jgi:hypothetical protein
LMLAVEGQDPEALGCLALCIRLHVVEHVAGRVDGMSADG